MLETPMNAPTRAHRAPLLDRATLTQTLAGLRAAHADDAAFRKAAVETFRVALDQGRAQARAWSSVMLRG